MLSQRRKSRLFLLLLTLLSYGSAYFVYRYQISNLLDKYQTESNLHSQEQIQKISLTFERIYEGLRTIARLPSVRNISRYAENFTDDARTTTQEIYNNIASGVSMSEVYIVPKDMQPDLVDPNTHKPQSPIITFDHLIVGKTADTKIESDSKINEIEIYEYRLMRQQMQLLEARFATEKTFSGLSYPMISGPEVITCDNSRYSLTNQDDKDRSGIVLSVPIYDLQGNFKGQVSGVILSHALRDLITTPDYVIINKNYSYFITPYNAGQWMHEKQWYEKFEPSPHLLYSKVMPLNISMNDEGWLLWVGHSDAQFWSQPAVRLQRLFLILSFLVATLTFGGIAIFSEMHYRHQQELKKANLSLEERVAERTEKLDIANLELQTALQQSNALAQSAQAASKVKSQFLANMSHEIRTPLNGIIGIIHLLSDSELTEEQFEYVKTVKTSSNHLLRILNDILEVSRLEAGKLELNIAEFDIREEIHRLLLPLIFRAKENNVEFSASLHETLPAKCLGDTVRIGQIINNLANNALKFTPPGGSIDASFNWQKHGPTKGTLEIVIIDTGAGIPEDQLETIFDEFTQADNTATRKHGGAGLGLSICKGLVQLMGGFLSVNSRQHYGSAFTVLLPLTTPSLKNAEEVKPRAIQNERASFREPKLAGHVLLVEDNEINQRVASSMLIKFGLSVKAASNGEEALEKLSQERFDLVVMDCQMPVMSGYEATRQIRLKENNTGAHLPIIALTAHALEGEREKCLDCGMDDFVTKPVDPNMLHAILKKYLRRA